MTVDNDQAAAIRSFAEWFRDLLKRRQLSQMEAAVRLGIHIGTVQAWLRSTDPSRPNYEQLVQIARVFHELPDALEVERLGTDGSRAEA